MNVILQKPWAVESFLAWEDKQEGRRECTRIIETTDGSRNHQRIVMNFLRLLDDVLDDARFEVIQEMRVTNGVQARYPDTVVFAGPVGGKAKTLRNAIVVCEVLSDDTEATDTEQKLATTPGCPMCDITSFWIRTRSR